MSAGICVRGTHRPRIFRGVRHQLVRFGIQQILPKIQDFGKIYGFMNLYKYYEILVNSLVSLLFSTWKVALRKDMKRVLS